MSKKNVAEDCSGSNPPLGQEHQFQTPGQTKSVEMTYLRKKRGNNLTPIDHTPTPRGEKHLGFQNRGIHKDEMRKKNRFEIKLREQPVAQSVAELEGREHNVQEEVRDETNREIEEEGTNDEAEEEARQTDDGGEEEDESNDEEEEEEANDEDEENDEETEEEENDEEVENTKGKEVVVYSPPMQRKEKKPRKEPAPKGLHIPKGKELLLPAKKNIMLWGEAPDKSSILFGYKDSWAAKVCQTRDHARCTKLLKRQRAKRWPLSKECALVRDLVVSTGLGHGILNCQTEYDSVVVSAFRERYWLETDTFHLPFGEMTITPDDVKQITDLEVEGQSVFEGFNNNMAWSDLYALLEETLGWGKDETEMEFKLVGGYDPKEPHKLKNPLKKLLLKNLRKNFKGTFKREKAIGGPKTRDGPKTRGGGSTNKRGRGGRHG